jgi:hypothetical protein
VPTSGRHDPLNALRHAPVDKFPIKLRAGFLSSRFEVQSSAGQISRAAVALAEGGVEQVIAPQGAEVRNTKYETRNPKQIQTSKTPNSFSAWDFEFVSDFGFRASDFKVYFFMGRGGRLSETDAHSPAFAVSANPVLRGGLGGQRWSHAKPCRNLTLRTLARSAN